MEKVVDFVVGVFCFDGLEFYGLGFEVLFVIDF